MVTRRVLLAGTTLGAAAALLAPWARSVSAPAAPAETFPIQHSDAEWQQRLSPDQYAVLREARTERPFTSPLLHEERRGTFTCAGCQNELYDSTTKFDSGTGWPSFWAPLEKGIGTTQDRSMGMLRTAVHCARCGGHLGHVFDDGPKPTGLRYCMNGVAMAFQTVAA